MGLFVRALQRYLSYGSSGGDGIGVSNYVGFSCGGPKSPPLSPDAFFKNFCLTLTFIPGRFSGELFRLIKIQI